MPTFSRREAIFIGSALVAGGLAEACTFGLEKKAAVPTIQTKTLQWPRQEDPKFRFVEEISALQPSTLKSLLETHVLKYFRQPTPFTLHFDQIPYEVTGLNIRFEYGNYGTVEHASFTPQIGSVPTPYTVNQDQSILVPLLYGIRDEEKKRFPSNYRLPDDTPLFSTNFIKGNTTFPGLYPEVVINRSNNAPPQTINDLYERERFAFIKEAVSWLSYDVMIEQTIKKMKQFGLPTDMDVFNTKTNKPEKIPATMSAIRVVINQSGRTSGVLDLAGYLLALRAVEGSAYYQTLMKLTPLKEIVDQTKNVDFGQSADVVLANATSRVFSTPSLSKVGYVGDLNKIP